MMNKLIILFYGLLGTSVTWALSGPEYMQRFHTYSAYMQQLPIVPTPEFLQFVQGTTPLSNKVRDKWLYELARIKDWKSYVQYYQPTTDTNLMCYHALAQYNMGTTQEAVKSATPLWLSGESRPKACDHLFELLLKDGLLDATLITQRLHLALERRNVSLARYLLKQYKVPHTAELDALQKVHQAPKTITLLKAEGLSGEIYLYGLKRLVSLNMDTALRFWAHPHTMNVMNEAQQQNFLAHIALYKAMRNSADAQEWFAKIKPQYIDDVLMDWQIRFALKHQNWEEVSRLIQQSKNKDTPCWQYWLGRSLEEQGRKEEAQTIYESLAKSRQYYGFLASVRLKKSPSFINEPPTKNLSVLKPYQEIIEQVRTLYWNKNQVQASRLLNDFISELPKEEASALVYWIDTTLQWHGKSVFLSNTDLLNNQLTLRFPLAYKGTVKQYAQKYAVPPEFVYAIIRQESGFREDATSSAGARGLMQVMPYTAGVVAKEARITYSHQNQLFGSEKNINIGVAYLKQLAKRFSNHPILIAAAYNAGPKQVVYWLRNHPPKDLDIWIETLPWQETRNYLKNVMAFYVVYQYRLQQKPDLKIFLTPLSEG